jgi:hypothetical protein
MYVVSWIAKEPLPAMQIPKMHKRERKEKIKTTTMHVVTQASLFFFPNFVI